MRAWRVQHELEIVRELTTFLAIPNIASDAPNIERNAGAIVEMFSRRQIEARTLRIAGAPPLIVADMRAPGATRTIAFYAHYDGQPVDPSQWRSAPWQPELRDAAGVRVDQPAKLDPEWRLYARSSSDDKAAIVGLLAALDAIRTAHLTPHVNVKFVFEGEEEAGSPHLAAYLAKFADDLHADAWLLCDGPVHQSRRVQIVFGARGTTDLELTIYGPMRPLHSGHYGNWAPNPIVMLTHLLDSMRDEEGRILIDGYYDDVRALTAAEKEALAAVPDADDALRHELGLARTEGSGKTLKEQILLPAINVRGISSGHVGAQASNTIQSEAHASIDLRLVPAETPESVRARVERHIEKQGYFLVKTPPDLATRLAHPRIAMLAWGAGYPPGRTSMDLPFSREVVAIMTAALGSMPIRMPTLGGSVPMYLFEGREHTPVLILPIANHDNNQHAANENLRLQNLWDGIEIYAALMAELK
ncbi:MAG TPA: M20/M25/M40 family metallo-hydrolase [Thermoanaerobaculia bacterium]|nr:M20/M25/M40 family metallo-hydrolase [Thermoanaerobaculia bacterium]